MQHFLHGTPRIGLIVPQSLVSASMRELQNSSSSLRAVCSALHGWDAGPAKSQQHLESGLQSALCLGCRSCKISAGAAKSQQQPERCLQSALCLGCRGCKTSAGAQELGSTCSGRGCGSTGLSWMLQWTARTGPWPKPSSSRWRPCRSPAVFLATVL